MMIMMIMITLLYKQNGSNSECHVEKTRRAKLHNEFIVPPPPTNHLLITTLHQQLKTNLASPPPRKRFEKGGKASTAKTNHNAKCRPVLQELNRCSARPRGADNTAKTPKKNRESFALQNNAEYEETPQDSPPH